ncbi:hypothetical protein JCM21142_104413 [Saccharicrinis fermentans DSM 9555 = JCM 21142]|uniref:Uncharacterized protein n=1 Tax=Saccharicrinis fermentans DSM 9555 = JCM 21142 TaxID=869213 RepID=W7YDX7_9BACT|nr:hypothetical protein JCM21142_104413 [Saccharicrinis fermentans DSM 9555 = JCM 21142]
MSFYERGAIYACYFYYVRHRCPVFMHEKTSRPKMALNKIFSCFVLICFKCLLMALVATIELHTEF